MMNPEVKNKWISALLSGHYAQTTGKLECIDTFFDTGEVTKSYCCLGVLREIVDPEHKIEETDNNVTNQTSFGISQGLTQEHLSVLMDLNDDQHFDFQQIARVVRAFL